MKRYSNKIYIDNLGFANRGDQLMIQAVLEQIRSRCLDAQILVRADVFMQNPTYCMHNRLYPLSYRPTNLLGNVIKNSNIYAKIVNFLLRDGWVNRPQDVDVILDCRGYHLTDSWIKDESYATNLSNYYSLFCKKGRKMIMLPQAFGPFTNEASKRAMEVVFRQADIVYARERQSYDYLQDLFGESDKIDIVPDFTCLCADEKCPSIRLPKKEYVLIIPNARMVDYTDDNVSSSYIEFLIKIVRFLVNTGETVYLLNHEGERDEQLLYKVNEQFNGRLPILTNLSGSEIRLLIKDCKLLISARYHGVVSGLTQGVPTLCTSWSHKYAELLCEHGCENNMLDVSNEDAALETIKMAIINPKDFSSKIGCEEWVENKVKKMWTRIFKYINSVE